MEEAIILKLQQIGAIQFGDFILKSGIHSPIYIDLRLIISYPKLLEEIAEMLWEKIKHLEFDYLCGVPYTALPIATALSLKHNIPMVMRRKEAKNYGTKKLIEGVVEKQKRCLVVEDLITSGASLLETIEPLQTQGLNVTDCVVFLDREQGGKKKMEEKGYQVHSVITMSTLLKKC